MPQAVQRWLADPTRPKWVHDAKELQAAAALLGIAIEGVAFDTTLAAYLLDPAEGSYPLGGLTERYLGADLMAGGIDERLVATLAAFITTWTTFVPCFLWIFLGAPYIESLRGNQRLKGALSGITAAVVGVVLNLALVFGIAVIWPLGLTGGTNWFAAVLGVAARPYMLTRVRTFVAALTGAEVDTRGAGFQLDQSLIAIGSGGWLGRGIGGGHQKYLFLPEAHTDFIFSIIGEELGFIGAISLIGAFAFLVWRGFRIVQYSQDRFVFYAALGCTLIFAIQALINISVALCLLPTKGLPLPLVSYGGSSLIASLIAIGMLLNFSQQSS